MPQVGRQGRQGRSLVEEVKPFEGLLLFVVRLELSDFDHGQLMLGWILIQAISAGPQLPFHSVKVFGNFSLGYYYATIYVGTPLRPQTLLIDTGSQITAMPCSRCTECGTHHLNPLLNAGSTSFRTLDCRTDGCDCGGIYFQNSCDFRIGYTQGSTYEGFLFSQRVAIGDSLYDLIQKGQESDQSVQSELVTAQLGCIMKETKHFYEQGANGILGLNRQMSSNLLRLIFQQHTKQTNEGSGFSLCFGFDGGYLTVGGTNRSHIDSASTVRLPLPRAGKMFEIELRSVRVQGAQYPAGNYTMLDSGTTYSFFNPTLHQQLREKLDSACLPQNCKQTLIGINSCYTFSDLNASQLMAQAMLAKTKSFPVIELQFEQGRVSWSPLDYLIPVANDSLCLTISQYNHNILGTSFFRHKNIYFDHPNSAVEITSANCTESVEQAFFHQLNLSRAKVEQRQYIAHTTQIFTASLALVAAVLSVVAISIYRRRAGTGLTDEPQRVPSEWQQQHSLSELAE